MPPAVHEPGFHVVVNVVFAIWDGRLVAEKVATFGTSIPRTIVRILLSELAADETNRKVAALMVAPGGIGTLLNRRPMSLDWLAERPTSRAGSPRLTVASPNSVQSSVD